MNKGEYRSGADRQSGSPDKSGRDDQLLPLLSWLLVLVALFGHLHILFQVMIRAQTAG
jgi:hypothetical protein